MESHIINDLFAPSGLTPRSSPQLRRILLDEIHLRLPILIPNNPAPVLPKLKLLRRIRIILGPGRQTQALRVRVQVIRKRDQTAHDVERVLAERGWDGAEGVEGDVGDVEGAEDGEVVELGWVEEGDLAEEGEGLFDLVGPGGLAGGGHVEESATAWMMKVSRGLG